MQIPQLYGIWLLNYISRQAPGYLTSNSLPYLCNLANFRYRFAMQCTIELEYVTGYDLTKDTTLDKDSVVIKYEQCGLSCY